MLWLIGAQLPLYFLGVPEVNAACLVDPTATVPSLPPSYHLQNTWPLAWRRGWQRHPGVARKYYTKPDLQEIEVCLHDSEVLKRNKNVCLLEICEGNCVWSWTLKLNISSICAGLYTMVYMAVLNLIIYCWVDGRNPPSPRARTLHCDSETCCCQNTEIHCSAAAGDWLEPLTGKSFPTCLFDRSLSKDHLLTSGDYHTTIDIRPVPAEPAEL